MEKLIFRCSELGRLMTPPRNKSEELSETAKSLILEKFIEVKKNRKKVIENKYLEKGLICEEEGILAYNVNVIERGNKFIELSKNKKRETNDYITGEPDIVMDNMCADVKSCWDIFTFYDKVLSDLDKAHYWQMQGYMWLFDKPMAELCYTLINTPEHIIERETRYRTYNPNEFIFDDLPQEERIHIKTFKRETRAKEQIITKTKKANEYFNFLCSIKPSSAGEGLVFENSNKLQVGASVDS